MPAAGRGDGQGVEDERTGAAEAFLSCPAFWWGQLSIPGPPVGPVSIASSPVSPPCPELPSARRAVRGP